MHPGRRVQFAPRETSLQVVADPLRVRQVIANLLSNAFKHSPADSPVEVSLAVQARQAVVSVADQGEGIPLADRDRVFERFHRVESTTTRGGGGTGLGLYIARQLVEAMSGRLWLESELGQGTSLSFTLPLAEGRIELVRSDDDPSGDTRSEVG
jgi:signal transduction histidine kinase